MTEKAPKIARFAAFHMVFGGFLVVVEGFVNGQVGSKTLAVAWAKFEARQHAWNEEPGRLSPFLWHFLKAFKG